MTTPAAALGALTTEQKIAMTAGADNWHTVGVDGVVPVIRFSDGPAGVRGTSWVGPPSASLPCGAALGATFDPDLVRLVGKALGREARSKSAHVVLAPTVNLHRTPIGGRNFECLSEDPVLTSVLAVAYVEGVQGEGVACCIKHFVGNDTEFQRMTISSEIDARTLREMYLAPFEAAVRDARVRAVMTGYNRLNGTFCGENAWLITDVLRGEWGYDGVVISDWFGTHSAGRSLAAGLDLEMPGPPRHRTPERLAADLDAGVASRADLDRAVSRIIELAEWTGAADTGTDEATLDDPEIDDITRRAAIGAAVLLKNEGPLLPIAGTGTTVALIGPYAEFGRFQGGGSARVRPSRTTSVLDELGDRGFEVVHEAGCDIDRYLPPLRGHFDITYFGAGGPAGGAVATATTARLEMMWQDPPAEGVDVAAFAASIAGEFTPDVTGDWEFGLGAIGAATVRLEGNVVVAIPEALTGGSFFGLGSPEIRVEVPLEEGRRYRLEVECPVYEGALMRGVMLGARPPQDRAAFDRAVRAAAAADVAVLVVGTSDDWETEGEDRASMDLPGRQNELVAAVAAANPNTVVVLNAGSPVTMPWLDDVPAVLQLWFPGQALAGALADVLVGAAEPGGRLPLTFPVRLEDTPAFAHYAGTDGKAVYAEGLLVGHRWYDRQGIEPLFPFGHGLGYTTFDINPGRVSGDVTSGVVVEAEVANTGERRGSEVVQVYVEAPGDDPTHPLRELEGFTKVTLDPGERTTVAIAIGRRAFEVWDGGWHVPPGDYRVLVGRSSRSLAEAGTVTA